MASVFPEVNHNAVRSRKLGKGCSGNRVRLVGEACLSNCGDMINIYSESWQFCSPKIMLSATGAREAAKSEWLSTNRNP
jgi:hypothetical protein